MLKPNSRSERKNAHIKVQAKTFGCPDFFDFISLNVSYTGLLVASKELIPFQPKTILEVVLDPNLENFDKSIKCVATIGRIAKSPSSGTNKYIDFFGENPDLRSFLGIYFSDITLDDQKKWFQYVDSIQSDLSDQA